MNKIFFGDCRETLRNLAAEGVRVQMCVTSPPYFGLRDYGHDGQIGLEETPEQFIVKLVEVFREVRRVLADDGVLWVNIGDSYCSTAPGTRNAPQTKGSTARPEQWANTRPKTPEGMKPKDLIGIPWALAKALRDPYYAGKIKREADRAWLAAIIDGEGCFFIHKRGAGASTGAKHTRSDGSEIVYSRVADTYSVGLEICNTSKAIIERIQQIAGIGTVRTQSPQQNARRKQTIYRWRCSPTEAKQLARELYPHLVAKQHQARLIFGCPTSGTEAAAVHQALMNLHNGVETSIDCPAPPTMFEPGWYLRQDIIWAKPNPMPESVQDRCTKAHEYLFLLSKSPRYFYDHEAVKEPVAGDPDAPRNWWDTKTYHVPGQKPQKRENRRPSVKRGGFNGKTEAMAAEGRNSFRAVVDKRNRRSVWTIATRPYAGAHFAVFPPALVEPCILAGSRPGDTVLDPFMGSGTTAAVAIEHGRQFIGCELNPEYKPLQDERIAEALRRTAQGSLLGEAA